MLKSEASAYPTPNNGPGLSKKEYIAAAAMQALIVAGWKQAALVVDEAKHYAELMITS